MNTNVLVPSLRAVVDPLVRALPPDLGRFNEPGVSFVDSSDASVGAFFGDVTIDGTTFSVLFDAGEAVRTPILWSVDVDAVMGDVRATPSVMGVRNQCPDTPAPGEPNAVVTAINALLRTHVRTVCTLGPLTQLGTDASPESTRALKDVGIDEKLIRRYVRAADADTLRASITRCFSAPT